MSDKLPLVRGERGCYQPSRRGLPRRVGACQEKRLRRILQRLHPDYAVPACDPNRAFKAYIAKTIPVTASNAIQCPLVLVQNRSHRPS
jgi:hypothetical protein